MMTIKAPDTRLKRPLRLRDLLPQGKVTLYHMSDEDFEWAAYKENARREKRGQKPWDEAKIKRMGAFARWGWFRTVKTIYMRCGRERSLAHELLHIQEGQYHD